MKRGVSSFFVFALFFGLAGCAGPLTMAQSGVKQCSVFLRPAAGGVQDPPLDLATSSPINMLILSGGGKYGAYGAGVLAGWSQAEVDGRLGAGDIRRSSISILTGISTGALQATAATVGNAMSDPQARLDGPDKELIADYEVNDGAIGKERGLVTSLSSNGLMDIRGRLDLKVAAVVDRYWDRLRALPADRHTYVGMVNLDNGKFYFADLVAVAKSGAPNAKDCYREFVLASAAVPVQFAPRFIDGSAYVDGGVRFGTFLGDTVAPAAVRAMGGAGSSTRRVSFRAIINGTLSPNDPVDDAAGAAHCDESTLATVKTSCKTASNTLLGIAGRSAGQILVDQIYRDSALRLERELARANVLGTAGFLYVPNAEIAEAGCKRATKDGFDRTFMNCLTKIGKADGQTQIWKLVDELPRAGALR